MLKLVISLCATTFFFATAQADYVSTLNFTSPSTTSSTVTITAGGTVDFEAELFWEQGSPLPVGVPSFFNTTGGIDTPISSCTGVTDCQENQTFIDADSYPSLVGTGYYADFVVWQSVPGQVPFEGGVAYLTDPLGTSSYSLTYPNPGTYTISTSPGDYDEEDRFYLECTTYFVNGVASGPADCDGYADVLIAANFDTATLTVDVLPAEVVPEPSYRILLAALLGVPFVLRRRAQSTRARRPA